MEKKLRITFFGGFTIESEYKKLSLGTNTSTQTTLLLTYLLMNIGVPVSKSTLIDALWANETEKDLSGALRTLVYRARKELVPLFPNDEVKFIKFTGDSYYWNENIPCDIDIVNFDTLNSAAKHEDDPMKRYSLYRKMYDLYDGDFMPNYIYAEFILYRNVYLKNEYVRGVLYMCDYLMSMECCDEVISICDQAAILCPEEERLYSFKIKAYLALDLPEQALDYYNSITNSFSHKLGLDITPSFSALYDLILEKLPLTKLDIKALESTLQEPLSEKSPYYCDFNMFKNFYQISKRSVRRSFSKRYLVLFTLSDEKNPDVASTEIDCAMKILFKVICSALRQNDVYTKTSDWQYSVIIMVPNQTGAELAVSRLKTLFLKENLPPSIRLSTTLKCIE